MRPLGFLLATATLTGCFFQAMGGITTAGNGRPSGGLVELAAGIDQDPAVRLFKDVSVERLRTDHGGTTMGGSLDLGARFSVPSLAFAGHDWARWFDFGADAGVGLGASGVAPIARVWAGPWADVRLFPHKTSYPTLGVRLRREAYATGLANQTEVLVALGWTWRETGTVGSCPP